MFQTYRKANLYIFFLSVVLAFASCTVVKNYPPNTPFVFDNEIKLEGDVSKDEMRRIQAELYNYWDDSLKPRRVGQFGVRTIVRNPPRFDTSYINPSITFMRSYLQSQGFYNSIVEPILPHEIDTVGDQLRATVRMAVNLEKNLRISSFTFDSIQHDDLRVLAKQDSSKTLLRERKPFNKQLISGELDRLVNLYRNNGYLRMNRENLYAEVDTTEVGLLDITLDPFEQARRIAEATQRRLADPTIDVAIRSRPSNDTNAFTQFYVGRIYLYPETEKTEIVDSLIGKTFPQEINARQYTLKQHVGLVKLRPLREHTYLREGTLYDQSMYFKTINAYSSLGPWNQVDVRPVIRVDTVPIVDFHFFLTPAPKYSFGTDLEVSRNTNSIITGNLLGVANVITFRRRNVAKQAIQASTTLRNGIELGLNDSVSVLQTFQSSITQTFSFPRFITPFRIRGEKSLDDYRTLLSLNASYTDRRNFFKLSSAVLSFGYEWKRKNHAWIYRPLNVELYSLDTLAGLRSAFVNNPFLRNAFNTGYVISQTLSYSYTYPGNRAGVTNFLRISGEEAGAISGRFPGLRDKIYQYIKGEAEFRKLISYRRTGLAFRFFGGVGYNYSNDPVLGRSLPFFKQYIAGGPNSMRAWNIRQLGLGSSLLSDTSSVFRDRFGDVQLETNIEYRYPFFTIGSINVNSAVFADIGNLWNLKNPRNNPDSASVLRFDRFFRDLAIGVGTGLRFDISSIMIRLDFAYKVKDPAREKNNGWMSIKDFSWTNDEYNIVDANGRRIRRNNYAFQLGIGLPF
ncbi:BamA/TamA family outer membrane protein [Aridibaculum aurantiacum]|uniref:BamA/TamA family outer membrane protein n=1 Tax=Aridibaculum aurantiacum TaxID=2810307 RepID=UPI001A96EFD1|nr:BamA/TamA family outer membrane protein [Aridibaculum aurantiacum]